MYRQLAEFSDPLAVLGRVFNPKYDFIWTEYETPY